MVQFRASTSKTRLQERAPVPTEREAGWAPTAGLDVLGKVSCPRWDSNPAPSSQQLNRHTDSATKAPAKLQETKIPEPLHVEFRNTSS